jgi:hypothetical protein
MLQPSREAKANPKENFSRVENHHLLFLVKASLKDSSLHSRKAKENIRTRVMLIKPVHGKVNLLMTGLVLKW